MKASVTTVTTRGEKSLEYFRYAYAILLAIAFGVIALLDTSSTCNILLMLLVAVILYWLCFFSDYFRNKIVGVMSKAELHKEKRNS